MLRCCVGGLLATSAFIYCKSDHNLIHIWGNGVYRPRPGHSDDVMNFTNFAPKLIKELSAEAAPNIVKLTFGPKAEAGIDEKGAVYIWEKHTLNSVKIDEVDDESRNPTRLALDAKAVDVKFVREILFALDSTGKVWQWRFDKHENPEPRQIPRLLDITKICAGAGHFVALDKHGTVWAMGDDTYGQCGIDSHNRQPSPPYLEMKYPNPFEVTQLPLDAIDIACGKFHTLALLKNGEVWGWGRNHKYQLADTDEKVGKAPALISYLPTKVNGLMGLNVVKIAAGDLFSIFVVDNNGDSEVYGCGLNSRGQLGLGYVTHVTDMIKIQNLSNFVVKEPQTQTVRPVAIKDLQCGAEHCLALMDVGAVYSWGGNEFGEQGNRKRMVQDRPLLLKKYKNKKIVSIAAAERNSAVIYKE